MSMPPPPAGPPPSSPPPSGPPPAGPPSASGRPRWLPLAVVGGVLVLLAVVVVLVVTLTGSSAADADSVDEVADLAVDAAEDLDVDQGVDLLCAAPDDELRDEIDELISGAQDAAGTDDPDVDYRISDVEGDSTGSFVVTATSDEDGLEDRDVELKVFVERDGDRSCIAGAGDVGDDEPEQRVE